jgi:diadenylate cyclase
MNEFILYLQSRIDLLTILDIAIISFFAYQIMAWIKGTQAEQVAKGIIVLIIATQVSVWIGLETVGFVLESAFTWGIVVIVIMFQPELRSGLEKIGNNRFFKTGDSMQNTGLGQTIDELVTAVEHLSQESIGALIVLEKNTGLDDIIEETGIRMNAYVTSEIIENVFTPNRPMHDGAMVISLWESKIKAAGCLLPLTSNNQRFSKSIGTRHRAGIGITEQSDSVVVIVSEETGTISYAKNGELKRYYTKDALREEIFEEFDLEKEENQIKFLRRLRPLWRKNTQGEK